ncbi:hypothetical protein Naga_101184g1 [Nannochloropsis gaditana]|uniref:Uncharacterized protein n=1 Tax=Nannochloropsis gaditana TaxID=72520 RepID=W7TLE1_9STRA|nr:hypothetical protein Naga_101184g1 [Nannochloropsis gaditana]
MSQSLFNKLQSGLNYLDGAFKETMEGEEEATEEMLLEQRRQRQLRMTAVQQQAAFGSALYPSDSGTQESGFPPGMVARKEDAATGKGNEIPVKEEKGHEHLAGTARKPAPPAPSRRSPPPPHPGVHIRREGGSAEEEVAETPACLLGMSSPLAAGPLVRESEVWKEEAGE